MVRRRRRAVRRRTADSGGGGLCRACSVARLARVDGCADGPPGLRAVRRQSIRGHRADVLDGNACRRRRPDPSRGRVRRCHRGDLRTGWRHPDPARRRPAGTALGVRVPARAAQFCFRARDHDRGEAVAGRARLAIRVDLEPVAHRLPGGDATVCLACPDGRRDGGRGSADRAPATVAPDPGIHGGDGPGHPCGEGARPAFARCRRSRGHRTARLPAGRSRSDGRSLVRGRRTGVRPDRPHRRRVLGKHAYAGSGERRRTRSESGVPGTRCDQSRHGAVARHAGGSRLLRELSQRRGRGAQPLGRRGGACGHGPGTCLRLAGPAFATPSGPRRRRGQRLVACPVAATARGGLATRPRSLPDRRCDAVGAWAS